MTNTLAVRIKRLALAAALTATLAIPAASGEPAQESFDVLDPVLVIGEQTPLMWKVSRDGHDMWILGTHPLQPAQTRWLSTPLDSLVAGSKEVLLPGPAMVTSHGNTYLTALIDAGHNPGAATLKDLMPRDTYARWLALRQQYGTPGLDGGPAFTWSKDSRWLWQTEPWRGGDQIDRLRPTLAWEGLRRAALLGSGMASHDIEGVIRSIAGRHRVPVRKLQVVRERVANRKHNPVLETVALADFGDMSCLIANLDVLEPHIAQQQLLANAWARGDLQAFVDASASKVVLRDCVRELVGTVSGGELPGSPLSQAARDNAAAARRKAMERVEEDWLKAAQRAIRRNTVTFAVLPVDRLLAADGYLEKLRKRGFEVGGPPLESR